MATAACTCTHTTGVTTADMAVAQNPVTEQMLYLWAWQDHQRSPSSGHKSVSHITAHACSEHLCIAGKVEGPVHRGMHMTGCWQTTSSPMVYAQKSLQLWQTHHEAGTATDVQQSGHFCLMAAM